MRKKEQSFESQLQEEIQRLRDELARFEEVEKQYKETLRLLSEKESFNFALFQYNPFLTVVVNCEGRVVKSNVAKRHSGDRLPNIGDIMYRDYAARHTIDMYGQLMDAIHTNTIKHFKELKYEHKYLSVTISPFPQGAIIISQDITEQKITERDRDTLISELRRALNEVEILRGMLPICASCKKIRDDKGYWNHIETYLSEHSHLDFTHTLCPECIQQHYPEYWDHLQSKKNGSAPHKNSEA